MLNWLRQWWGLRRASTTSASPPDASSSSDVAAGRKPSGSSPDSSDVDSVNAPAAESVVPVDDVVQLLDRWAKLSASGQPIPAGERSLIEAAYDAAQSTFALKAHWQMSDANSADAANSYGIRKILRERSRYESGNNSYLCGMFRTIANDVIGRGPRLQMLTTNERINNRVERLWKAWAKRIKLSKKLRIARQAQVRDGEVFLLFVNNNKLPGPVKLDLQVIECDQVEDYFFMPTPEQPVSGLELDKSGNAEAYHVFKFHPGSAVLWAENPYEFDRIESQFVIHMFRADRPQQHRGIPECTSSLSLFAILRSWTMATLDAARIAGTMNFAIGTRSNQVAPAKITNVPAFTPLAIPPGTIPLLPEGWEPLQSDMQRPVQGFSDVSDAIVNEAARPMSMPRNIATGNSSNYNFSSAKMDKATYYAAVAIDQHDIAEDVLDPVLQAFLAELEELGELDTLEDEPPLEPREELDHQWEFDTPDPIDEQKTAEADRINLSTGKLALGPSDHVRMMQTAKYLGLTVQQYQDLIVRNAFAMAYQVQAQAGGLGNTPGSPGGPAPGVMSADGPGQPGVAPLQPSAAEFSTTSRLQWQRNRKAIDDILDQYATGAITMTRALIFLQTLGLVEQTAKALLEDATPVETNPTPTAGNTGVTA